MDSPFPEGMLACVQEFFLSEGLREPGQDVYPDVFDTPLFFPLQRQAELAQMMREARAIKPRVIYEIGADKGGGLYHWCKSLPTVERAIACEIRGTPYRNLFQDNLPQEFCWIEGSSYDPKAVNYVKGWLDGDQIDCLFIDGDKSAFDRDFDAYLPLMNPDGIVFMHDINDRPPAEAYHRVVSRGYKHKAIIDTSDSKAAMDREERGIPSRGAHEGWLRQWKGQSCGVGVIYLKGGPSK